MLGKFYQQIQVIMAVLGYYEGACNGVWGQKSIDAMRKWELADDFEPATPQNGKPFTGRGKLPDGIHYGAGLTLITEHLYSEKAQELLKTPILTVEMINEQCGGECAAKSEPEPEEPKYVHQAHIPATPVEVKAETVEEVAAPEPQEVPEPEPEETPVQETVQVQNNQNNQPKKQDWTKNRNNR